MGQFAVVSCFLAVSFCFDTLCATKKCYPQKLGKKIQLDNQLYFAYSDAGPAAFSVFFANAGPELE